MIATRYDRADIEHALIARGAQKLLADGGYTFKPSGGHLRSGRCPACGEHSRADVLCVNVKTLRWDCKVCNVSGGPIDLAARIQGVEIDRDFPGALRIIAEAIGVAPASATSTTEQAERRARIQRERDAAALAERERKAAEHSSARRRAMAYWSSLFLRDRAGEAYLRERGLDALIGRDDMVRFTRPGAFGRITSANEPEVMVRDVDGEPVSVTCRRFPDRVAADLMAKTPTMLGCPTAGTLVGSVADIVRGSAVYILEGIIDTLTAVVAWPGAVALGASGVGRLPFVAGLAAPYVKAAGGQMFLVPQRDESGAGAQGAIKAGQAAIAAGLEPGRDLHVVDIGDADDLNDAWCAGWRP